MPKRLIVSTGKDPLTKPVLDYLEAKYGMSAADISRVRVDSPVGAPQTIELTLYVDTSEAGPCDPCADPERHAEGGHDV